MKLKVKKAIGEAIGFQKFTKFGISKESWGWRDNTDIDLRQLNDGDLDHLQTLLATVADTHGVKVLLRDIDTWRAALTDASKLRPRTVRHFETLLQEFLAPMPRHWVFGKFDRLDDVWLPYYVNQIEYHPERKERGDYTPAHVDMDLVNEEFEGMEQTTVTFYEADLRSMTVREALARKGYYPETEDLVQKHVAEVNRFGQEHSHVGKQFTCTGTATDDVDGNREGRHDSWYWKRRHYIPMVRNEEPAKVVMDLFREEGEGRDKHVHVRSWFWDNIAKSKPKKAATKKKSGDDDDDDDDEREFEEDIHSDKQPDIPIHPFVAVFDLAKHLRLRVHINQLTAYTYDLQLADKLVLPDEQKSLVRMLIEMKSGGFRDIVKGKGGGAVVLLAGPPGTGKTLTAEVYAESESRGLYSVQCSQLGTDPEGLEDELLKVFARARRWNAVMLLDEADVYVHSRGNDMQQNAIVGVFLRVLEYQDSVLFLTTNRPDDVDDAIASRCIARLTYGVPDTVNQARIWKVLADATGTDMDQAAIDQVVAANPQLSGRDVKNLLKLARLIVPDAVTADAVEFVKQFKPTAGQEPTATVRAAVGTIGRCPDCGRLVGKKGHVCRK